MNQHQLSAILFSDIVGFSQYMGNDELTTMNLIRKNRRIHKAIIKKHHGKWCKEMGDGTMACFPTISDAVYCAGWLQKKCAEEKIKLRIGIHQGEIVKDNGDLFGDVINIASRLESVAKPGQILVSQTIYRNIKNKSWISGIYAGEKKLKNIESPIKIYQLSVDNYPKLKDPSSNYKGYIVAATLSLMAFLSYCSSNLQLSPLTSGIPC